ncbi:hypothetical protein [Vampirovibrio chlorellavorus]|uniref:hypothetical protein n=1 Tax=Vampirovibrio chlorellavorus TaxID=758823 RepID=UPI0026ECADBE|nr:hypothetical protein [Vampirovibrio chlorellavorus]
MTTSESGAESGPEACPEARDTAQDAALDAAPTHRPPQGRSPGAILAHALSLYAKHWKAFTCALIGPVTQMVAGAYGSQGINLWLLDQNQVLAMRYPWTAIGLSIVITLLCTGLMLRGGWQYVLAWASLCLNAWEAENGQPLDFKKAYQSLSAAKKAPYAILACTYFSLPALAFLPFIFLALLGVFLGPSMLELLIIAGILQSLLLGALWVASLIPLTFTFQIAAFENGLPANPVHTFLLSSKFVLKQFWKTTCLQITVFLLTNILIPQPLIWLFRLFQLSAPLDQLHRWLIQQLMAGMGTEGDFNSLPLWKSLLGEDFSWVQRLSQTLTDLSLSCTLTLLLLPLGTLVFTLLYKDILKCDRSKKTWLGF